MAAAQRVEQVLYKRNFIARESQSEPVEARVFTLTHLQAKESYRASQRQRELESKPVSQREADRARHQVQESKDELQSEPRRFATKEPRPP